MFYRWLGPVIIIATLLMAVVAYAQPQQPASSVERSLVAAVQQIIASTDLYASDMQRQLAAKDKEIADLKEKCGDPCKSPAKLSSTQPKE